MLFTSCARPRRCVEVCHLSILSIVYVCVLFICLLFFSPAPALGQETGQAQTQPDTALAIVGDDPIMASQVEHEFRRKLADRKVSDKIAAELRNEILIRLCRQQLIMTRLKESSAYGTDDEVNLEVSRLKEQLQRIEKSLDVYLKENHQSLAGLKFNLRWQICWKRYLDQMLVDANLEKYFERFRSRFDGTRVKASQILLAIGDAEVESVIANANDIRQKIVDGQITWNAAATEHSTAPSSKTGGDVGWIDYSGPMSRSFTEAAYRLKQGEISPPVQSPFGIHLVRCDEIKPGTLSWYDVKDEIRRVATHDLFERLWKKQQEETEIRMIEVDNAATDDSEQSNTPDK